MSKEKFYIDSKLIELLYGEDVHVLLESDMKVGIGGEHWPAADLFCKLIVESKWRSFFIQLLTEKSIIELGSGNGLVSIVLNQICSPKQITVTDLKTHLLLIHKNITVNNATKCEIAEYDWCNIPSPFPTYDIILAFECVYREDLFEPLIKSLKALSRQDTIIFLGVSRSFAKSHFFQIMRDYQFKYTLLPWNIYDSISLPNKNRDIGIFLIEQMI